MTPRFARGLRNGLVLAALVYLAAAVLIGVVFR